MGMGAAANLMRQGNSAHGPFCKAFAVNQDAFRCPEIFVGDKADEIAIIFVDRKVGESKMSNDIVVEAMKMEHKILAAGDATVSEVRFAVGDRVDQGDLLVALDHGEEV